MQFREDAVCVTKPGKMPASVFDQAARKRTHPHYFKVALGKVLWITIPRRSQIWHAVDVFPWRTVDFHPRDIRTIDYFKIHEVAKHSQSNVGKGLSRFEFREGRSCANFIGVRN